MHRHNDIRLLLEASTAQEKKVLLKSDSPGFSAQQVQHLRLLWRQPNLSATAAVHALQRSPAAYKTACEALYKRLLIVLAQCKQADDIRHQVQHLQTAAATLMGKALFEEAQKKVAKAIQLAQHYELQGYEIDLQYQHHYLRQYLRPQPGKEPSVSGLQRIAALQKQQTETEQLRLIYHQLLLLRYQYALCILPEEQQQLAAIAEGLAVFAGEPASTTARIYFYQAHLLICFMLGRTENILLYNDAMLHSWRQYSHLIALQPELFIRSAAGQAYTHFLAKEVDRVALFLEEYRQLAVRHLPEGWYQHRFAIVDFHTTLKVLHKTFQYEQLAAFFAERWPNVYRVLHVLHQAEKVDILLSACITFFALQQWAEAEALILEIKEANRYLRRSDTLYFSFVFHCLILFEQREWSRLHSLINSEYHFLYRNKTLRPFERDMLLFIKKLPLLTISANGQRHLKLFLQKLDSYKQHPVHRLHFTYFDFYTWLESKLEGLSYMDLVKRKAAQARMEAA